MLIKIMIVVAILMTAGTAVAVAKINDSKIIVGTPTDQKSSPALMPYDIQSVCWQNCTYVPSPPNVMSY